MKKIEKPSFRFSDANRIQRIWFFYFMVITVNGETYETSVLTLKELLETLGIQQEKVAIEANLSIIKRADYNIFRIKEGDSIEIVHFVGGG